MQRPVFYKHIESSEWPLAPPRTQVCKAGTREREGDLQVCGDPSPLAILKQVDFPQESVVQSAHLSRLLRKKIISVAIRSVGFLPASRWSSQSAG